MPATRQERGSAGRVTARYLPGRWLAIGGPGCWTLLDLAPDDARVPALRAAVAGTAPVEAVLGLLLAGGLDAVPGLVVVGHGGTSLRYVVRHPATLRIDGAVVAPAAGLTWTDALTSGLPAEVTLLAGGAAYGEGGDLALGPDVTPAGRITVSLSGVSASSVPTTPPPELIDGVPWMTPHTQPVEADELPGATRMRPPATPPTAPPPDTTVQRPTTGPMVWAVRCPEGHLTSPYSPLCRVCAAPVPEQPPVQVARPPLGHLVLSTGLVVTLDRGVVLGRSPQPSGEARPHLVRVTDATEVSRSHAEVRLEEWHVLLRDLGSANGTVLTLPGRRPEQIRPGEDHHLEPGCTVSLADVAGFRYEVTG